MTIAGTGRMGEDKQGGQLGVEQAISSPWDVTLGSSLGIVHSLTCKFVQGEIHVAHFSDPRHYFGLHVHVL